MSSSDDEVVRRTVQECKTAFHSDQYFDWAESSMDKQWEWFIWPDIKGADFSKVLELAPGYGRNTALLVKHSQEIHLVDVNKSCIDRCKKRFTDYKGPCKFAYYVKDGKGLADLRSNYFTLVYS